MLYTPLRGGWIIHQYPKGQLFSHRNTLIFLIAVVLNHKMLIFNCGAQTATGEFKD